ncbi:hypothetical protein DPM19_23515 [Actinomadura craniellae]|uniref:DUF6603 domain-containing protein n=1 Tax=Actinomadura craniellae TaxID=2231787 RepID=A0A365H0F5_9ACTN|nr:kelch motif-containing protein [Actinomadura craniellae]RAY12574.1 hypothetical protein DPM19_23515 [Actinomadura craniellae]
MTGTVERLAIEVGKLLEPITERLASGQLVDLFADLGLPLPPAVANSPAVQDAASSANNVLVALPAKIGALVDAVADGDDGAVAAALTGLLQVLPGAFSASRALATAVRTAVTGAGPVSPPVQQILTDLPQRLIDFTAATYLLEQRPALGNALALFGLVDNVQVAPDGDRPGYLRRGFRTDRLGTFLRDPLQALAEVYGWGNPATPLDVQALFTRLRDLAHAAGIPVTVLTGPDGRLQLAAFLFRIDQVTGLPPGTPTPLDLVLDEFDLTGVDVDLPFGTTWKAHLRAAGTLNLGAVLRIEPPATLRPQAPAPGVRGEVTVSFERVPPPGSGPIVLLGSATGTRLAADAIRAGLGLSFAADGGGIQARPVLDAAVDGGKLVIDLSSGDGFLATLLGGAKIEADLDAGITIDPEHGLRFRGGGGLEVQLPVHVELGPVEVQAVHLAARVDGPGVVLELSAGFRAQLGPVQATVERVGGLVHLSLPPGGGDLGPVKTKFGFKPPDGVGLAVDAGVVSGGGYLFADADRGEYAGALELEFANFVELKAIGLISTRMPDGSAGFSLLIVITTEFGGGGLQLGYGFTLLAVGGLIGLNRGMNLQALVEGVRTGSIESVMFPRDVVANAPRILSDLRAFFPPEDGTFLVGPMAKIGWGTPTLVSVSLGVIVEIPGNLAILGVLKCVLPTEHLPLLVLQVSFIGAVEFDRSRLWFFAQLFDSRVLMMTLDGGMGLLVAWGDDPDLVLTVGGFHPSFTPPPLPFPVPNRLSVDILNQPGRLIRVSGYFAITSNTVQFGARAELRLGFGGFGVEGHLAFDALFRFSPFMFIIEISAGVSLKAFGVGLFGIDLRFRLEGPAPWRARGRGSISLLFFEISADFDITWGEERDTTLPPVDVLPLLASEIAKLEGWQTLPPAGGAKALVSLRPLAETDQLVLHPLGTLFVRQRSIPLGVRLDRVGAQRPADGRRFGVAPAPGSGLVQRSVTDDKFAMAQFQDMDDAAKLSRPAYEDQDAGLELAAAQGALASARVVRRSARYEQIVIDSRARQAGGTTLRATAAAPAGGGKRLTTVSPAVFNRLLDGSSTSRSPLSRQDAERRQPFTAAETVQITGRRYVVAHASNNLQAFPPGTGPGGPASFRSQTAAEDALADWVADAPALAGTLHVIPESEAAAPPAVPGTWTAAANPFPAAVSWAAATDPAARLPGGRVLAAGGADATGQSVAGTALFDPVALAWAAGPALATARRLHSTTGLADGRVLVAGGLGGTAPVAAAEIYDPVAGTWSVTSGGMDTARFAHSATPLPDGTVLVAGGTGARGAALPSAELFDPVAGTWDAAAPMTDARSGHRAVALPGGRVLVVGGALPTGGADAALAHCEIYDPETGEWTPTGSLVTPRRGHQATLLADGSVLVTGGAAPGTPATGGYHPGALAAAERYDPGTGVWTPVAAMPGGRRGHRAVLLRSGGVLVVGGTGGPTTAGGYRSAVRYDPAADTWTATGPLGTGRYDFAAVELADGRVVATGGRVLSGAAAPDPDADVLTATTEIFTP